MSLDENHHENEGTRVILTCAISSIAHENMGAQVTG